MLIILLLLPNVSDFPTVYRYLATQLHLQHVQEQQGFFKILVGGAVVDLVFSSSTIYCWLIIEKTNEVKIWNDAHKRTFKTKQYKQN